MRHILAAALLAAGPALATEPPMPTTDFTAQWSIEGDGGVVAAILRYSVAEAAMRIDMTQQGMAMTSVHRLKERRALMWSDQMPGMAMRLQLPERTEDIARTAETRSIGGETCTVHVTPEIRTCLTDDNIPLETVGDGFAMRVSDLRRERQDPALFSPPPGLQVLDMPAGMPGMGAPGGPGMPGGPTPMPF